MIKNFFRTEWAKLREMSFRDKRQYIWEYYKTHIIAFAVVVFLLGSFINIWFINPQKNEYLHFAWLYPAMPGGQLERLGQSLSVIVNDPDREEVIVFPYVTTDNHEFNMAVQTRFFALIQVGAIDAFFVFRSEIEHLASEHFIRPVTEVMEQVAILNPQLYRELADRVLTTTFKLEDGPYITDAMAICLSNAPLLEYVGIDTSELHLAVLGNAGRFYELAKALELMFDMRPEVYEQ